jgi:Na+-driven multidrug efflux pump
MIKKVISIGLPSLITAILAIWLNSYYFHILADSDIAIQSSFSLAMTILLTYTAFASSLRAAIAPIFNNKAMLSDNKVGLALMSGLLFTIISFIPGYIIKELYLFLSKADNLVKSYSDSYYNIAILSLPLVAIASALSTIIISQGKNLALLLINSLSTILTLCFVYIGYQVNNEGKFILKLLAYAVILNNALLVMCYLWFIKTSFKYKLFNFNSEQIIAIPLILKNAAYAGGQLLILMSGFAILILICAEISLESTVVMAALQSINRSFILPSKAFGTSIGIMANKNKALGNYKEAKELIYCGITILATFIAPIALLLFAFPNFLMSYMIPSLLGNELYISIFQIAAISLALEPLAGFLINSLIPQGKSKEVFYLTLYQWVVAIPSAWFFGIYCQYGLIAVWLSILSFRIVLASGGVYLFSRK